MNLQKDIHDFVLEFFNVIGSDIICNNGEYEIDIPDRYANFFESKNLRITFDEKIALEQRCELMIPGNSLLLKIIDVCSNKGPVTLKKFIMKNDVVTIRYYFAINFSGKLDVLMTDHVDVDLNVNIPESVNIKEFHLSWIDSKQITETYLTALEDLQKRYTDKKNVFLDDVTKKYKSDLDLLVGKYDSRIRELDDAINLKATKLDSAHDSQEFRFQMIDEIKDLEKTKQSMIKVIQKKHHVTLAYNLIACQVHVG